MYEVGAAQPLWFSDGVTVSLRYAEEAGSIVWHLKVIWHHELLDEPVEIFSEVGEDRCEVRKVEVFRDGRLDWADESRWSQSTMLGEVPVPPLEEINEQEEFTAAVMSAEEFEEAWAGARRVQA